MKFITDQIEIATKSIKLEKPVVKLTRTYGSTIGLSLNNKVNFDEEALLSVDGYIIDAIRSNTSLVLNLEQKVYEINTRHDRVIDSILYNIERNILNFLSRQGGHANNRQTKTYRWYKEKINAPIMGSNEKLTYDLYNIMKFADGNLTEEQIVAVRTLLNIIKDRYEPILGVIEPGVSRRKRRRRWYG